MTLNRQPTMKVFLLLCVCINVARVFGQSNYASHGNNINYIGNGLPEETVLDGKVSDIEPFREALFTAWAITVTPLLSTILLASNWRNNNRQIAKNVGMID